MKNKRIVDAWNKIEPDSAADKRMSDAILARNHADKIEKEKVCIMSKTLYWKRYAPIAVCLVLAIAISIPLLNKDGNDGVDFELKLSTGVKVNYVDNPPITNKADLVWLSEDELFASHFNSLEIVAFEGTVKETRNIVCDYNGSKDYRAIAAIEVSEVLRGALNAGDTVTVLLPGPVGTDIKVEDTGLSSQITADTRGIFMPIKYDETSIRQQNDATLALLDLAEYGFPDGVRWMFLETAKGLAYLEDAYPSLAAAQDLEDVKAILLLKLR